MKHICSATNYGCRFNSDILAESTAELLAPDMFEKIRDANPPFTDSVEMSFPAESVILFGRDLTIPGNVQATISKTDPSKIDWKATSRTMLSVAKTPGVNSLSASNPSVDLHR